MDKYFFKRILERLGI